MGGGGLSVLSVIFLTTAGRRSRPAETFSRTRMRCLDIPAEEAAEEMSGVEISGNQIRKSPNKKPNHFLKLLRRKPSALTGALNPSPLLLGSFSWSLPFCPCGGKWSPQIVNPVMFGYVSWHPQEEMLLRLFTNTSEELPGKIFQMIIFSVILWIWQIIVSDCPCRKWKWEVAVRCWRGVSFGVDGHTRVWKVTHMDEWFEPGWCFCGLLQIRGVIPHLMNFIFGFEVAL